MDIDRFCRFEQHTPRLYFIDKTKALPFVSLSLSQHQEGR